MAAQDTTEINVAGRGARRKGLGPAGDGSSCGFFIHPALAVDADSEAVLGIAGARIWTRDAARPPHQGRPFEDKESLRWLEGAETAAAVLGPVAAQLVMTADREGDIYPLFARRPAGLDFIVRASHDRALAPVGSGADAGSLVLAPAGWEALGAMQVCAAPRGP